MIYHEPLLPTITHYEPLSANVSHSELLYDDGCQCNDNSDGFKSKKYFNLIYIMYVGKKTNIRKKWAGQHQFFLRPQVVHRKTKQLILN